MKPCFIALLHLNTQTMCVCMHACTPVHVWFTAQNYSSLCPHSTHRINKSLADGIKATSGNVFTNDTIDRDETSDWNRSDRRPLCVIKVKLSVQKCQGRYTCLQAQIGDPVQTIMTGRRVSRYSYTTQSCCHIAIDTHTCKHIHTGSSFMVHGSSYRGNDVLMIDDNDTKQRPPPSAYIQTYTRVVSDLTAVIHTASYTPTQEATLAAGNCRSSGCQTETTNHSVNPRRSPIYFLCGLFYFPWDIPERDDRCTVSLLKDICNLVDQTY